MTTLSGPVIITGGAGFMGFYIIQALLKQPGCGKIVSINRNPKDNLVDGVDYRSGSIADTAFITALFEEIKPQIVIHTASPRPIDPNLKDSTYQDTNVEGTRILLEAATKCEATKAFIFTSTVNVQAGYSHKNVDESGALWEPNSKTIPYWRSKAGAERLVLLSNNSNLKTVTLRLPLIIGERDYALTPAYIDIYNKKQHKVQLGDGKNCIESVSAENAADAHIVAAKALLDPSLANGKVDGEAFHITDGNPIPYWTLCRMIWKACGDTSSAKDAKVIPTWAAYSMATFAEWSYALFTFGTKSPQLTKHIVSFCVEDYTYDNSKAKKVLGFNPEAKTEEVLQKSVQWELRKREAEKEAETKAAA